MHRPRIVIAGTESGAGKTTLTLGLLVAFKKRGLTVQGFKVGPDYIDPGHHTAVTGRPSRNLDTWMMPESVMEEVFFRGGEGADLSIVEGVMGLFDGRAPDSDEGSTAQVAERLTCPVLLVVDAGGMARSAAAVVRGFQNFRPGVRVAGVIVNRVGGEGHFRLLKTAVEGACGIPVVGWLREDAEISIPERHLGLVTAAEGPNEALYEGLGDLLEEGVDLEEILRLAREAPSLHMPPRPVFQEWPEAEEKPTVAVARDAAFHFYYPENLDLLRLAGAEWVEFSPLAGEPVPLEADGVWLGGGFPEIHAADLAAGEEVKRSFREAVKRGMPVYAECGGYMYLCREIVDSEGHRYPMAGVIPAEVRMQSRLTALGYREVQALTDSPLLKKGEKARGHQFRYSTLTPITRPFPHAYNCEGGWAGPEREGYVRANLIAGYTHLHFASNPAMAERWVNRCRQYRRKRNQHMNQTMEWKRDGES
ncbi:cobyrinic acid a,c-diamide synthase [Melghirimyces profundicolus]|uniref:Cobyrinate a,c-diamide synthase n=1 Tax=Melghirimyces profundicolus TaxID=1242148 RepID=A0A2T6BGE5_9BACL|nr:cobyrinate a,c-diamide synthase [Melghirimyces profundicolus]PTX55138.1 cobyrinic acid a,c-diamide synthase [Melghirimyces profundicolus]